MGVVGIDARRVHRHEPADRRDPGHGLAARPTTTTSSRRASRPPSTASAAQGPRPAPAQPGHRRAVPARLDLQAGDRARARSRTARSRPTTQIRTEPVHPDRSLEVLGLEQGGLRLGQHLSAASLTRATRSSTGWRACSASTGSPTGRTSGASASPTGIDLPGEVAGIVPTNDWKRRSAQRDVLHRRGLPGRHRPGLRRGHAPSSSSTPTPPSPTAARSTSPQLVRRILDERRRRGRGRVEPEVIRKLDIDRSVLRTMRVAARRVVTVRHTYNLVDLPIVVAGKSGTAEFGIRDRQGRLPFHNWFVAFVPKDARKIATDPNGIKAVAARGLRPRRPRLRQRHADRRQCRDRDRQVLPAAPLRPARSTCASAGCSSAPTSMAARRPGMGTLRLRATPALGAPGRSAPRAPAPLVRLRRPARHLRALADRHRPAHGLHEQRQRPARSRARCSRAASSG